MEHLNESEVTVNRLDSLFKSAFFSCSVDSDGDLKVEDSGILIFIRIDPERKVITYNSLWRLKPGGLGSNEKKIAFANQLNNDYRLVRFSVPKPEALWCDYQLLYEGGINPFQIINSCRVFSRVCKAILEDDTDNLIA